MGGNRNMWYEFFSFLVSVLLQRFRKHTLLSRLFIVAVWLSSVVFERYSLLKHWYNRLLKLTLEICATGATGSNHGSSLIAPYFFIRGGTWECAGYDSSSREWRRLPHPFSSILPRSCMPDPDLFKEYLVCSHRGIMCMNVSKGAEERLVVLNPLTGNWRELPPLKHRRNPVLMHLVVDAATQSFRVVVAGSARSGDGHLSRVTEEFDSRTWEWKRTGDLPGPVYALNEFQSGVCKDGSLYCIAFLDHEAGKGILRYNLNKGTWLQNWTYPIPFASKSSILQLVESWGELYLFSEQVNGNNYIEHCVDRVECETDLEGGVLCSLSTIIRHEKFGGKSLEVYPEYTCVPYTEHQLCLLNALDHSGVVYDVRNQQQCGDVVVAPPTVGFSGESLYSLNAMSFTIEPCDITMTCFQ